MAACNHQDLFGSALGGLGLEMQRQVWYARLRRNGFIDIEDSLGRLTTRSGPASMDEPTAAYYRLAGRFLYCFEWRKEPQHHQAIWELHSDGMTNEVVATRLGRSERGVVSSISRIRKHFFRMDWDREALDGDPRNEDGKA
jgi:hypothetical protein